MISIVCKLPDDVVICECGTVLTYDDSDVVSNQHGDFTVRGFHYKHRICCPECGCMIKVDPPKNFLEPDDD